jgi:hypothetical protein
MPRIPGAQQSNRISISSPVPIDSTGSSRLAGESLANLGEATMKTGAVLNDIFVAANDAKNKAQLMSISEDLEADAKAVFQSVKETGKADGTNWVSDLNVVFEDRTAKYLDEIDDPELKLAVRTQATNIRNALNDKMLLEAGKKKLDFAKRTHEETQSKLSLSVFKNPESLEAALAKDNEVLETFVAKGLLRPFEKDEVQKKSSERFANQAIQGTLSQAKKLYARGDERAAAALFAKAEEKLAEIGHLLDPDVAKGMPKAIDDAYAQASDIKYKNEMRADTTRTRNEKRVDKEVSRTLAIELYTADTIDKQNIAEAKALSALQQKRISRDTYESLMRTGKKLDTDRSNELLIDVKKKLYSGDEKAIEEADDQFQEMMGSLDPQVALKTLDQINKIKSGTTPLRKKQIEQAYRYVEDSVKWDKGRRAAALDELNDRIYRKGEDPFTAQQEVVNKALQTVPLNSKISAIKDEAGIKAYAKDIARRGAGLKPDSPEYKTLIKDANDLAVRRQQLGIKETK